ncbi:MAG: DUF6494 family protein [Gammaproteobacteria bacterium]|nr:DUF6494 family protein [Gammaproteobacteria bacterium]
MDEDVFNQQIRKFLKKVGITAQREIEMAVRAALENGTLGGNESLQASVQLTVSDIDLSVSIDDTIKLS